MTLWPVTGCGHCGSSGGVNSCPYHGPSAKPVPSPLSMLSTRTYRMECVSCRGSGVSQRPVFGTTAQESCKGCEGRGWVNVMETFTAQGVPV